MKEKKEVKEILFTSEQADKMLKLLNSDIKETPVQKTFFKKNLEKIVQSLINLFITIITLKDTGKWISVISLLIVFYMFFQFLKINAYSIVAMTLVAPYLGEIAIVVFGIIGGAKTIQSVTDKILEHKNLIKVVKDKIDDEKN